MRTWNPGYFLSKISRGAFDPVLKHAIREKHPEWFNRRPDERKKQLLDMPIGCKRPTGSLGACLYSYLKSDPDFRKKVEDRHPRWFERMRAKELAKKELLSIVPSVGVGRMAGRPSQSSRLGQWLSRLTRKGSDAYDAGFDKVMRDRHPDWFYNGYRNLILSLPKGSKKPGRGTKIGRALENYMQRDPDFRRQIKKKYKTWTWVEAHSNRVKKNIRAIFSMKERPSQDTYLGRCLSNYLKDKPGFKEEAMRRKPEWFIKSSETNKKTLLMMPVGCEKPTGKMLQALTSYISKSSGAYDEKFKKRIMDLHPGWFGLIHRPADEKKRILLAMPKGCKKPLARSPLGAALFRYTSKYQYDEDFDRKIRNRQPGWWPDRSAKNV